MPAPYHLRCEVGEQGLVFRTDFGLVFSLSVNSLVCLRDQIAHAFLTLDLPPPSYWEAQASAHRLVIMPEERQRNGSIRKYQSARWAKNRVHQHTLGTGEAVVTQGLVPVETHLPYAQTGSLSLQVWTDLFLKPLESEIVAQDLAHAVRHLTNLALASPKLDLLRSEQKSAGIARGAAQDLDVLMVAHPFTLG